MMTKSRWILPMAIMLAVAAAVPPRAMAASCLNGYYRCLNDSWDTSGISRILADIDCFSGYVGCVRRQI
jgi:hypothetical protein